MTVLEARRLNPAGAPFGADAYVFGNALGERTTSVREAWERARAAAGLAGLQLRDLRHQADSRFDEAGVPTNFVSKLLGHTNLSTTSRYLNIQGRSLHLAMQQMEEHRAARARVAQTLHMDSRPASESGKTRKTRTPRSRAIATVK